MGIFEGCVYYVDIIGGIKGVICFVFGQIDQIRYKIFFDFIWIDKICYVEMFSYFFFGWVEVDFDDLIGICKVQVLDNIEVDFIQFKDNGV